MSDRLPWFNWERWERLYWDDDPRGPPDPQVFGSVDESYIEQPQVDTRWDREREDRQVRA